VTVTHLFTAGRRPEFEYLRRCSLATMFDIIATTLLWRLLLQSTGQLRQQLNSCNLDTFDSINTTLGREPVWREFNDRVARL